MAPAQSAAGRSSSPSTPRLEPVSSARLRAMVAEIIDREGAHLFVSTGTGAPARMDWYRVEFPAACLDRGEPLVWMLLLHEWGHRIIDPGCLEQAIADSVRLSKDTGASLEECWELMNIASDLWVDAAWLAHGHWGERYFQGWCDFVGYLSAKRGHRGLPIPDSPRTVVSAICEDLNAYAASLAGHSAPQRQPEPVVDRVCGYLYDPSISRNVRARRLYDDLAPFLGEEWRRERLARRIPDLLGRALRELLAGPGHARLDIARLAAAWRAAGLDPSDVGRARAFLVKRRREDLWARVRRLEMYSRIVRRVDAVLAGRRGTVAEGWKPWSPGDRTPALDVVATLERNGRVLPGVTTLQGAVCRRPSQDRSGAAAHLCLIVDDSGSMDGAPNEAAVEAALGVIEAANRFGDLVSLVVFGSSVVKCLLPGGDYEGLADAVCALDADAGGTELQPALARALAIAGRLPRGTTHYMLLTDAGIFDLKEALPVLRSMTVHDRMTVFCFEEASRLQEFLATVAGLDRLRVFVSPTGAGFDEGSLVELLAGR